MKPFIKFPLLILTTFTHLKNTTIMNNTLKKSIAITLFALISIFFPLKA